MFLMRLPPGDFTIFFSKSVSLSNVWCTIFWKSTFPWILCARHKHRLFLMRRPSGDFSIFSRNTFSYLMFCAQFYVQSFVHTMFRKPTSPFIHFKWYVSFAKEPYTRDNIPQKRPVFFFSFHPVRTMQVRSVFDDTTLTCLFVCSSHNTLTHFFDA